MSHSIRLIAGLGNPGREYAQTRHNVGFVVVDALAAKAGAAFSYRREFEAEVARCDYGGTLVHLIKPQTFMNESGRAVGAFMRYHRLDANALACVFDEINLPVGRAKLSDTGSAGGHNGLASIISHVGGGFARFRVGVGPKLPAEINLKDYVLGKFTPEQTIILTQNIPAFLDGLDLLIRQGLEPAMNRVNRRARINERSNDEEAV